MGESEKSKEAEESKRQPSFGDANAHPIMIFRGLFLLISLIMPTLQQTSLLEVHVFTEMSQVSLAINTLINPTRQMRFADF
jgi:hypothetical protein